MKTSLHRAKAKTFVLLSLAGWLVLGICGANQAPAKSECCKAAAIPPGPPLTSRSIYQVDSLWRDSNGRTLDLKQLRGKLQVVALFFASCHSACPILVHDMKRIEKALPPELKGRVEFLLVSFDAQRDTAEVLTRFQKNHGLGSNWRLVTGQPEDVLELAALLGVKFKENADGQFDHSNLITILNAEGEIIHQQLGLNSDVTTTMQKIKNAANAASD
jgi:protein SCO1/2